MISALHQHGVLLICSNKQKNNKNLNASTLWETTLVKLEAGCVGKEEVIFVRPAELPDNQVETVSLKESEAARLGWGLGKERFAMLSENRNCFRIIFADSSFA